LDNFLAQKACERERAPVLDKRYALSGFGTKKKRLYNFNPQRRVKKARQKVQTKWERFENAKIKK